MKKEQFSLFVMTFKGYSVLQAILENEYKSLLELVVIGRDKNVMLDYNEQIKHLCEDANIPCVQRDDFHPRLIKSSKYALAISWRWLINLEGIKLLVMHDSLLPSYRGFAPLVNQLIQGETTVGVTLLFATDEYDKGNIIQQAQVELRYPVKIQAAIEIITSCYIELTLFICRTFLQFENFQAFPQNESKATYSLWRDEFDYYIDWSKDSATIRRFVDAVGYPYTGAKTFLADKRITIYQVAEYPDVTIINRDVGKVIFLEKKHPVVACGEGLLLIKEACFDDGVSALPLKRFRSRFSAEQMRINHENTL